MDALFDAIKAGDLEQVKGLVTADPSLVNAVSAGGSAVLIAAYYGKPEVADYLIAQGATLSIFEAAATGQVERVRSLLVNDPALVNTYAPDGFQPLGLAAFFGHTEIARLLLESGAQVNSPSNNGQRVQPLHSSVAGGHFELSKLLLERGADVNAKQEGDFTPLQAAAQNGQRPMVEMLLAYGADKTPVNREGKRAVDYAREGGHSEIASLLE